MNPTQFHLLINHVPVFLPIIAAVLALAALLLPAHRRVLAIVAAALLLSGSIGGLMAHKSGEDAEHALSETEEHAIEPWLEPHEEAGKKIMPFLFAGVLVGAAFLASLRWGKPQWMLPLLAAVLAASIAVGAYAGYTAHLGGLIRHEHIRPAAGPAQPGH